MTDIKRPTINGEHGGYVTTPRAAQMMQILGSVGITTDSVVLSRDEFNAIKRLYGYQPERPNKKPPPPVAPKEPAPNATGLERYNYEAAIRQHKEALKAHAAWTDPQKFMQAGADRNAIRDGQCDGLRLLAWIAKFVPEGEDPMKTLVRLAIDAGLDVDPNDIEYCDDDEAE